MAIVCLLYFSANVRIVLTLMSFIAVNFSLTKSSAANFGWSQRTLIVPIDPLGTRAADLPI
jgi:hypothetical protein